MDKAYNIGNTERLKYELEVRERLEKGFGRPLPESANFYDFMAVWVLPLLEADLDPQPKRMRWDWQEMKRMD